MLSKFLDPKNIKITKNMLSLGIDEKIIKKTTGLSLKQIEDFLSFTSIAITIAAGCNHSLFLDSNGNVWSVGYNDYVQLGLGDKQNRILPEKITSLPQIIAIAAGAGHNLSGQALVLYKTKIFISRLL